MTYGQKIAQLRKLSNMTQARLGELLNVSAQAVSKWEHDIAEPDLATIKKLTSLFHISIDEFLDTDKEIEVASTTVEEQSENTENETQTATAEETKPTNTAPSTNIVGFCINCGAMVTEKNIGQKSPHIMCKNCVDAKKKQEDSITYDKLSVLKKKRKKSIAWAIVTMILVIVIGSVVAGLSMKTTQSKLICVAVTLLVSYCAFTMVTEIIIDEGPMFDILEWGLESPIKLPGLIFEWDLDGIVWAICMKIFFSILGFLAGVAMFGLSIFVGLIVAPFTFPFNIGKVNNEIKALEITLYGEGEPEEKKAPVVEE